jgi:hypothetical protein
MSESKSKTRTVTSGAPRQSNVGINEVKVWVDQLYSTIMSGDDLKECYELFRYQGFNRDIILRELMIKCNSDVNIATELIILCALRGPRAASEIKLSSGKTPRSMNIPASGAKGSKSLSCSRITAATADLAAYYLKQLDVPKKISTSLCPAYLQFPSAGSISLTSELRSLHKQFSIEFSSRIKGEFNEDIYQIMIDNSYLDTRLNLFN